MTAPEFQRVEQRHFTDQTCLACVVAMITGRELAEVLACCGSYIPGRPLAFTEAARFLAANGYTVGGYGTAAPGRMGVVMRYGRQIPAVVIVEKDVPSATGTHAVLWTGRHVLDPTPGCVGERWLSGYQVREWWPVTRWVVDGGDNGQHQD